MSVLDGKNTHLKQWAAKLFRLEAQLEDKQHCSGSGCLWNYQILKQQIREKHSINIFYIQP